MNPKNRPAHLRPDPSDPLDLNMTPERSAARTCRYLWDARVDLDTTLRNLRTVEGNLAREGATWVGEARVDTRTVTQLIEDATALRGNVEALYNKYDQFRKVRATIADRGVA